MTLVPASEMANKNVSFSTFHTVSLMTATTRKMKLDTIVENFKIYCHHHNHHYGWKGKMFHLVEKWDE
jgi:hypothetical protein